MNHLISELRGKYQYRVYEDIDYETTINSFDESIREEIRESIDEGRYGVYGVKKFASCGCNCAKCDGWKEVDSSWGHVCKDMQSAIEEFLMNEGEEC